MRGCFKRHRVASLRAAFFQFERPAACCCRRRFTTATLPSSSSPQSQERQKFRRRSLQLPIALGSAATSAASASRDGREIPCRSLRRENPGSLRMRRNREIFVLMPPTKYSFKARVQAADSLIAIRTVADQLGQQRIVVHGHGPAFVHAAVAANARARKAATAA